MTANNPTITPEDLLSHSAWLQRLAARLVESASAAEDLVQDTFVAALRSPARGDRLAAALAGAGAPQPGPQPRARGRALGGAGAAGGGRVERALPTAEELLT